MINSKKYITYILLNTYFCVNSNYLIKLFIIGNWTMKTSTTMKAMELKFK